MSERQEVRKGLTTQTRVGMRRQTERGSMGRLLGAFWKTHALLLVVLGFPAAFLGWLMSLSWKTQTPTRSK